MKIIIMGIVVCCQLSWANALTLNVNSGRVAAKPIAIVPFSGNTSSDKIDFIVSSDLKQSGVFAPISPQSYSDRPADSSAIDYAKFQGLGVAYIVVGQKQSNDGKNVIRFAIADAFQKQVVGSYTVSVPQNSLRQGAHQVSDIILQKLTGVRGAFATRLVYVYESGKGLNRYYQIMVADSDGHGPVSLLKSRAPLMSPRFSPDGSKIAYVSFEGQRSQIIIHNVATGHRILASKETGVNSAPAWSPDGSKIAMVLSKDGNPEVYFKDLASKQLTRVTNNPGIDTEPVWSSDGKTIYYTSDRSGSPQLYKINLGNGALSRITSAGKYSAGADISKDGKKIALARNSGGQFIIGTVDLSNGKFNGVSKGFLDETPRFSPNGQMLIYTSVENNKQMLKIVNVDGSGENKLSTSGQIRDPDWSTYVK